MLDHFSLGVRNMEASVTTLIAGDRLSPRHDGPQMGLDGKWQANLYDPDGTRVELMEFQPSVEALLLGVHGREPHGLNGSGRDQHGLRHQGRDRRSRGGSLRLHRPEDHVRRQAHRRGRHGLRLRERDRGRAGPGRARRRHLRRSDRKAPGVDRHTPRVSVAVRRTALARRPLGRRELKPLNDWTDGRPETELNFKFYRQATNKIVGVSDQAAAFLDGFF